jgi:hypothetical protein
MAIQFAVLVRNAMLDAIETTIGTAAVLKIRTGAKPTNITDADAGTVLVTMTLASDWMNLAASGSKTFLGTWSDASADASGTAGHFRLYKTDGTTQQIQGSVSVTGGGGDMTIDNVVITAAQLVTVTGFTLTAGNA